MKNLIFPLTLICTLIFTGCFDTEQEITINDDGSGVFESKTDMSSILNWMKLMGGDDSKKMGDIQKDTIVSLAAMKDSVEGLSDREKYLLSKATLSMTMNTVDEIFNSSFRFDFDQPGDIVHIGNILKKIRKKSLENQLDAFLPADETASVELPVGDEMMKGNNEDSPEIDEYFELAIENGKISRKVNADKYSKANDDPGMNSLREMSQLGMAMKMRTVIHLPRPAKNIDAKKAMVSDDKKKITIEGTIDDFLEDPSRFEYLVEF